MQGKQFQLFKTVLGDYHIPRGRSRTGSKLLLEKMEFCSHNTKDLAHVYLTLQVHTKYILNLVYKFPSWRFIGPSLALSKLLKTYPLSNQDIHGKSFVDF